MTNRIGYSKFLQEMRDKPDSVVFRVALVAGAAERLMELHPMWRDAPSAEDREAWANLKAAVDALVGHKEEDTDSKDV